jgi:hypothetical protein
MEFHLKVGSWERVAVVEIFWRIMAKGSGLVWLFTSRRQGDACGRWGGHNLDHKPSHGICGNNTKVETVSQQIWSWKNFFLLMEMSNLLLHVIAIETIDWLPWRRWQAARLISTFLSPKKETRAASQQIFAVLSSSSHRNQTTAARCRSVKNWSNDWDLNLVWRKPEKKQCFHAKLLAPLNMGNWTLQLKLFLSLIGVSRRLLAAEKKHELNSIYFVDRMHSAVHKKPDDFGFFQDCNSTTNATELQSWTEKSQRSMICSFDSRLGEKFSHRVSVFFEKTTRRKKKLLRSLCSSFTMASQLLFFASLLNEFNDP